MAITKSKKSDQLSKIKSGFSGSELVIFIDYTGLSVADLTELRQAIAVHEATFNVYKNRLVTVALTDNQIVDSPDTKTQANDWLVGQLGYVQVSNEFCSVAKIIKAYADKQDRAKIKGGVFENKLVPESVIESLAALPPKPVLLGKMVQLIASPLSGLLLRLATPVCKVGYALESIKSIKSTK